MINFFKPFKELFTRSWKYYVFLIMSFLLLLFSSYKVQCIETNIQDSILNIVSILFPLIAGFLTFGSEILKDLNSKIEKIKQVDQSRKGRPTPDIEKREITKLKVLTANFKNVVINTFFISFTLIIFVLISKFNSFDFKTNLIDPNNFNLLKYLSINGVSFSVKFLFFTILSLLFLNLSYLIYFIIQVNQDDTK